MTFPIVNLAVTATIPIDCDSGRKTMAGRDAAKVRRSRSMAVASKMPRRTWQLNYRRTSKEFCALHPKCTATGVSLTWADGILLPMTLLDSPAV